MSVDFRRIHAGYSPIAVAFDSGEYVVALTHRNGQVAVIEVRTGREARGEYAERGGQTEVAIRVQKSVEGRFFIELLDGPLHGEELNRLEPYCANSHFAFSFADGELSPETLPLPSGMNFIAAARYKGEPTLSPSGGLSTRWVCNAITGVSDPWMRARTFTDPSGVVKHAIFDGTNVLVQDSSASLPPPAQEQPRVMSGRGWWCDLRAGAGRLDPARHEFLDTIFLRQVDSGPEGATAVVDRAGKLEIYTTLPGRQVDQIVPLRDFIVLIMIVVMQILGFARNTFRRA